ncbi:MAG: hypothetical protein K0R41_683, partial [Geminicoccaceae bacterium]|nr:hypothetical protein [Geminicoccaceae bacterium]
MTLTSDRVSTWLADVLRTLPWQRPSRE